MRVTSLGFLLLAGCSNLIPINPNPRPIQPLDGNYLQEIDVRGESPSFTQVVEKTPRVSEVNNLRYIQYLCSIIPEDDLGFDFLYTKCLQSNRNRHLVFLYNILKDKHEVVTGLLSKALVSCGYDCIILRQEPFLSKRWLRPVLPDPSNPRMDYDTYNIYLAKNVGRIIYHWLPQQHQLTGKYAFIGISMGGLHTIGAAAFFPEATLSIAVMAGGGNADLFKDSQENILVRNREQLENFYRERYPDDPMYHLYKDIDNLKFSVLTLARAVKTSKIRLMITSYDTSVPTEAQWRLYHTLGGPETRIYPAGHYSMAIFYFSIRSQLIDWLDAAFGE